MKTVIEKGGTALITTEQGTWVRTEQKYIERIEPFMAMLETHEYGEWGNPPSDSTPEPEDGE